MKYFWNIMWIVILTPLFLIIGSEIFIEHKRYWYPIQKIEMQCYGESKTVYRMKHTTGWTNVSYLIDSEDMSEVISSEGCLSTVKERYYDKWTGSEHTDRRNKIQKKYSFHAEHMERL